MRPEMYGIPQQTITSNNVELYIFGSECAVVIQNIES